MVVLAPVQVSAFDYDGLLRIQNSERCQRTPSSLIDELKEDRSGCCSWHGGVCGCSSGRAVCCDGNLSPSCGC